MKRKQEEQVRKMKELQRLVEGSQRNNDQSRTQIRESHEPLKEVLSTKLSLKHFLSIFAMAHLKSPDDAVNDLFNSV